ncbi:MAG: type II secretion system F family protein [Gordonibacter sp.]|nr:type II secretion system F family protein [Gordonibacter sp.]
MTTKMLESSAISAFCESAAVMHAAGIQLDEAVYLLSENMEDAAFKTACDKVYTELIAGNPLSKAIRDSQSFPEHVIDMISAGEHAGRLENALWSLARYYDEEARLYSKIKSVIAYPAALLCVMSVILLFTVAVILPVFVDVYTSLTGNLTSGSFNYVNISMVIGWIALVITLLCTALVVAGMVVGRSPQGRQKLVRLLEHLPLTRGPLHQMAVSRFTAALATFVAAGINTNIAMERATAMVENPSLKSQLEVVRSQMLDPDLGKGLAQAIFDNNVFEPIYARMLIVGTRSGSLETVLARLSETFFDDSVNHIDLLIDSVEPTLAAFLTVSVGATLIAVMLPLIGIMGSIG